MLEIYDVIYSYVHNEKMLYNDILKSYEYDTKTESLAKFILFPIPTAFGGFAGYKIAYIISQYLTQ